MSTKMLPALAPEAMPSAPSTASRTSGEFGSMVMMTSLREATSRLDAALSAQLWFQSERLISAVAILTKQKAVSANQISDGLRNTNQNIAVSLNALSQADRVKKARFEYGGDFGQGYSPCYVFQGRLGISRAESDLTGMAAITQHFGVADAALKALQAGADVALWITTDGIPDVLDKLEAAAKAGQLDQGQIDKSVLRVAAMKGPGAKCVK